MLLAELQQSNEKFKAFAKVLPDLTLILSEEGEYTNVYGTTNESLYLSQEHVINRNVRDIMPPEDANPIMAVIAKTLQTNEVQVFEYQLNIKVNNLHLKDEQPRLKVTNLIILSATCSMDGQRYLYS